MWFYNGIKVNILATTQKVTVALIYKINPVQITTITAENTKNWLYSVPNTIENIQFKKNCEKFSPIVVMYMFNLVQIMFNLFNYLIIDKFL